MPAAIDSQMALGLPSSTVAMTSATQTLTSASVDPIDMSMPRTSRVSIWPMLTTTRKLDARATLKRLL